MPFSRNLNIAANEIKKLSTENPEPHGHDHSLRGGGFVGETCEWYGYWVGMRTLHFVLVESVLEDQG